MVCFVQDWTDNNIRTNRLKGFEKKVICEPDSYHFILKGLSLQ